MLARCLTTGLGSEVLLYHLELGKTMKSFTVFQGVRVHGIISSFVTCTQDNSDSNFKCIFQIAIFGEKRVKLFSFSFDTISEYKSESRAEMMLIHFLPNFGHWVLDVGFFKVLFHQISNFSRINNLCSYLCSFMFRVSW